MAFALITHQELAAFASARERYGWGEQDFELQEDVFSTQKAEVEGAFGEVGVRCLPSQGIQVYRLGAGFSWVDEFAADLQRGRFGTAVL